ncbi:DEKNAAC100936 [Brettanomyces naardenensis]|uniref:DEKNAAC100936 n=1 Tax=Brettanomyces naardenensis TaxID=13370 RepID=A0A448YH07_BRENA|nr:DEKNAAC100936 [Brettanomyces naardenensis]
MDVIALSSDEELPDIKLSPIFVFPKISMNALPGPLKVDLSTKSGHLTFLHELKKFRGKRVPEDGLMEWILKLTVTRNHPVILRNRDKIQHFSKRQLSRWVSRSFSKQRDRFVEDKCPVSLDRSIDYFICGILSCIMVIILMGTYGLDFLEGKGFLSERKIGYIRVLRQVLYLLLS